MAAGSETAFRCLFDGHRDKLFAYMLRISGSTEAAKDIVQDVFLKVWTERSEMWGNLNIPYLWTGDYFYNWAIPEQEAQMNITCNKIRTG